LPYGRWFFLIWSPSVKGRSLRNEEYILTVVNFGRQDMSFLRKIPGFRSITPWKMATASLLYFFILISILAVIFGSPGVMDNGAASGGFGSSVEDNIVVPEEPPGVSPEKEEAITQPDPQAAVQDGILHVHFIDVGQGDAIFIQTPVKNILIDGGDRGDTVVNYLKGLGINQLDLVVGTHPHADHIGGLINVLQSIPVKEVIDPSVVHTTKTFEDYLTIIDEKDIKFTEGRSGMQRDLGGGVTMEILHPSAPSSSHLNDASITAKITFGQISFMLTGDGEEASERQILKRSDNLKSTILKVGHHGSRTSTTVPFLKAVNPEAAIIMCGKDNRYGHPHEETLTNLSQAGVDIYRTDIHGTIVVSTNGQTLDINVKKP
jgi:competence protein ComEC